jgi:hypothetical protein
MCTTASVYAEEAWASPSSGNSGHAAHLAEMEVKKAYALGIGRFDVDAHTEIIGWRLNPAWFFGRQDGLDSGLTLVWQRQANQISLSKEGLRLTRRF